MWTKRYLRPAGATIEGGTRTSLSLNSRAACVRSEPLRVHRWPSRVRWGEMGSGGVLQRPLTVSTRAGVESLRRHARARRGVPRAGGWCQRRGGSAASARELLIRGSCVAGWSAEQISALQGRDAGIMIIRGRGIGHLDPTNDALDRIVGSPVKLVQPSIPTVSGYILTPL